MAIAFLFDIYFLLSFYISQTKLFLFKTVLFPLENASVKCLHLPNFPQQMYHREVVKKMLSCFAIKLHYDCRSMLPSFMIYLQLTALPNILYVFSVAIVG